MVSRVYIVQDLGTYNFLPAQGYGELISCINGRVSHVGIPRAFGQLRKILRHITADDWLLPVGHPALIAYAGYLMAHTGVIRILSWDNQTGTYIPSQINLA